MKPRSGAATGTGLRGSARPKKTCRPFPNTRAAGFTSGNGPAHAHAASDRMNDFAVSLEGKPGLHRPWTRQAASPTEAVKN